MVLEGICFLAQFDVCFSRIHLNHHQSTSSHLRLIPVRPPTTKDQISSIAKNCAMLLFLYASIVNSDIKRSNPPMMSDINTSPGMITMPDPISIMSISILLFVVPTNQTWWHLLNCSIGIDAICHPPVRHHIVNILCVHSVNDGLDFRAVMHLNHLLLHYSM